MKIFLSVFIVFLLGSCTKFEDFREVNAANGIEGYRAKTILKPSELKNYSFKDPQPLINAGKVVVDGNYLFINEYGKGIHIFDNRIPEKPVNKIFLSIPANRDFYVKNFVFMVDNGTNIATIDAKVLENVVLGVKTIKDLVDDKQNVQLVINYDDVLKYPSFPIEKNVFFQCADSTKGIITEWEKVKFAKQPNCYR